MSKSWFFYWLCVFQVRGRIIGPEENVFSSEKSFIVNPDTKFHEIMSLSLLRTLFVLLLEKLSERPTVLMLLGGDSLITGATSKL
jgi:hypothetical protein